MGYTRAEMETKIDDILVFADIGDFVHQSVKMYSSGMFARLAFAVAINVDPDILIVDEALSVGDAIFQSKCVTKMQDMMRRGITILFVSHDIYSIQSFCNQAIFINQGKIEAIGKVENVISIYSEIQRNTQNEQLEKSKLSSIDLCSNFENLLEPSTQTTLDLSGNKKLLGRRSGNQKITILDFSFHDEQGYETNEIISNKEYTIKIAIKFNTDVEYYSIICPIRSLNGTQEIGVSSSTKKYGFPPAKVNDIYIIQIKSIMNLQAGIYNLVLAIEIPVIPNELHEFADILENCLVLNVVWGDLKFHTKFYTDGDISYEKYRTYSSS
jgi:ABC-type multidrug transport system ATPase subunit